MSVRVPSVVLVIAMAALALAGPSSMRVGAVRSDGVLLVWPHDPVRSRGVDRLELSGLPIAPGVTVDVLLRRLRITGPQTRFWIADPTGRRRADFDPTRVAMWTGHVRGLPGSSVFLAVAQGGLRGWIDLGPGRGSYAILPQPEPHSPAARGLVVRAPVRAGPRPPVALCGVEATGPDAPAGGPSQPQGPAAGPPPVWQVDLCVTADFMFFQLFGDAQLALTYIVELYGIDSAIFLRDAQSVLRLRDVVLQTTPDPPPAPNTPAYCDDHQVLSGDRFARLGGFASGGICDGESVCYYMLGVLTDPSVPSPWHYDIVVTTHELGHTLGAPHTHAIGIDTCNDPNSPARRGTIMSYCSQTHSGGERMTDLRLHRAIRRRIRNFLANRDCLTTDCNLNGMADPNDIVAGRSIDTNANGVPDECEDCNGNGVLDDADIANGTSADLDNNGVPDECQSDCNGNGVPDVLDIAQGTSQDAYGDGVPDECERDCDGDGMSDYAQLQLDMSLDLDRDAVLDACQDCDGDGISDLDALDGAHNLWVINNCDGILREYHGASGVLIRALAADAPLDGQDLTITSDGRVLVSDGAASRVVAFDREGFLGELIAPGAGGLSYAAGLTLTSADTLLVASRDTDSVLEFDATDGTFLRVLVDSGTGGLTRPFGMTIGPDRRLYVTSSDNRVLEFDADSGAFVRDFVQADDNGGLLEPRGLAFLPGGNLLVASLLTKAILEYDATSGAFVRQFNIGGPEGEDTLAAPWAVRIGPDGRVYAGTNVVSGLRDSGALHLTRVRIAVFDPVSGLYIRPYVMAEDSQLQCATGFAFMPDLAGIDCNHNFVPDACDIALGASRDVNANGLPDECECLGDLNGDRRVDLADMAELLAFFGQTGGVSYENGDLDASGRVDLADLALMLARFGLRCP